MTGMVFGPNPNRDALPMSFGPGPNDRPPPAPPIPSMIVDDPAMCDFCRAKHGEVADGDLWICESCAKEDRLISTANVFTDDANAGTGVVNDAPKVDPTVTPVGGLHAATGRDGVRHDDVTTPAHYRQGSKQQALEVIEDHDLGYHLGNVVKYVLRHEYKGGVQDLRKALFYLQRKIDLLEGKAGNPDDVLKGGRAST